jgi:predicted nucleic acid-binding protein
LGRLPLTYVDANILLDCVIRPDPADKFELAYHDAAVEFFEATAKGEGIAVISDLVLMEVLNVLRKQHTKPSNIKALSGLNNSARTSFVIDNAKVVYNELLTDMLKSPRYFKFMNPLTLDITSLLSTASDILYKVKGDIRFFHDCKNCCSKREKTQEPLVCVHKCVGATDIMHALIANEYECDRLVTFDKGFGEIVGYPEFYPLKIEVLLPKPVLK